MIPALIGAGASLLGSLFGKKKQTTTTSVNYGDMVASATAAGFNPLTAIRNGGSAGFTTTTSPTVSQMPEALANLGGVLGGALADRLDPIKAKKREIDTLLTDVQLKQARAMNNMPASFYQPSEWTGTKVSSQLVPRLGAASHKQTAAVPAAVKGRGAGPNGEVLSMYQDWTDRDGKLVSLPHNELPDVEQLVTPPAGKVENAFSGVGNNPPSKLWLKPAYGLGRAVEVFDKPLFTSRKLTKEEKQRYDSSWLPSWVPRLSWR